MSQAIPNDNLQGNRVFVGGISWKADEASLANFFSSYGNVVDCKIIMDKVTGKSKGYGFVTFETGESAGQVKQSTNLYFLGKMMNVGDAVRKTEGQPNGSKQGFSHQQYVNGNTEQGYSPTGFNPYYNQNYFPQQQFYNPNMYQLGYGQGMPYANYGQFEQASYPQGWQPMPAYHSQNSSDQQSPPNPNQQPQQPQQQYQPIQMSQGQSQK